jgi:hypothetical protein
MQKRMEVEQKKKKERERTERVDASFFFVPALGGDSRRRGSTRRHLLEDDVDAGRGGGEREREWSREEPEERKQKTFSSLSSLPIARLGHVLLEALAERGEAPGRGEAASAELEAQVLQGKRADRGLRGGEGVGVVHLFCFFVLVEETNERRGQGERSSCKK